LVSKEAEEAGHTLREQSFLWLCLSLGVSLRLWLSTRGHNFDLESFWIVSELSEAGKSVYAETHRYNYGPIWFLVLSLLREITRFASVDDIFHFHVTIAAFLTLVDSAIAMTLKEKYGLTACLFFILNPVSILITGYHSQFDNLAILIGWIGCCHLSKSGAANLRQLTIGAIVIGLSLATKHILLFLPFWMWWLYTKSSIKVRTIVSTLPWLIFFLCFVPFLFNPASFTGIIEHVVNYGSSGANGWVARLFHAVGGSGLAAGKMAEASAKLAFVVAVILSGPLWIASGRHPKRADGLMLLYLISLVAFSSSMMPQYLSIPLIALARYYRVTFSWAYSAAATYFLLTDGVGIFGERFVNMQLVGYPVMQILLVLVLVAVWRSSVWHEAKCSSSI
jgi:hypothetical protein